MKFNLIVISAVLTTSVYAGWMDTISQGMEILNANTEKSTPTEEKATTTNPEPTQSTANTLVNSLSSNDMDGALKEALNQGVKYALDMLGKENGYLDNSLTKIGLPENLQKTADLVRKAGGDKYVDDLILAFNNAATEAAPKTAEIFSKSILNMSIDDAKNILAGKDNAATEYFRKTTTGDLKTTIAPIIQKSMDNNEVAKYYALFQSFYKENAQILQNDYIKGAANMLGYGGLIPGENDENLNAYITDKSVDGIMVMIQEQEKEIRDNPIAQNSELINKVFSVFE